jgi:hypothetical protein
VELRERQQVIDRIVPAQMQAAPEHWLGFSGRRHKIIGKRTRSGADLPIEDRGAAAFEHLRRYQLLRLHIFAAPLLGRSRAAHGIKTMGVAHSTPPGRMDPCSCPACFPQGDLPCAWRAWNLIAKPDCGWRSTYRNQSGKLARTWRAGTDLSSALAPRTACTSVLALELGANSFWTFDDGQAKLANAEGFTTS